MKAEIKIIVLEDLQVKVSTKGDICDTLYALSYVLANQLNKHRLPNVTNRQLAEAAYDGTLRALDALTNRKENNHEHCNSSI